jgi:hypothetical protein
MAGPEIPATQNGLAMAAGTFGTRRSRRRSRENLLAGGIGQFDRRTRRVVRHGGIPRGTAHDVLVQKVLERMTIDEARRIAA